MIPSCFPFINVFCAFWVGTDGSRVSCPKVRKPLLCNGVFGPCSGTRGTDRREQGSRTPSTVEERVRTFVNLWVPEKRTGGRLSRGGVRRVTQDQRPDSVFGTGDHRPPRHHWLGRVLMCHCSLPRGCERQGVVVSPGGFNFQELIPQILPRGDLSTSRALIPSRSEPCKRGTPSRSETPN